MKTGGLCSWEEAVRWYREQAGNEAAVRENYFDLPVRGAAERYASSEEFREAASILGPGAGRRLLDFGAGNGIASFAYAGCGFVVTAFEPDPSSEVGAGAIRQLARETGVRLTVVQSEAERLPFADEEFDVVHVRQALHHVRDLGGTVRELARVLRRRGQLFATREHVAESPREMAAFLADHPLHHLYGGEGAHSLRVYLAAFQAAGLVPRRLWGPFESILNFYPGTEAARRAELERLIGRSFFGIGRLLRRIPGARTPLLAWVRRRDPTPGRLFSFLLEKP